MTAPEWLTARNGGLVKGTNGTTLFVTIDGEPQWRLDAVPARGKFSCAVSQTNNGKRLDASKEYGSRESALEGGLEELRSKLGW
jgi:hypothetical protein